VLHFKGKQWKAQMTNILSQEHFNPAPSESLRESHPNPFVFNDVSILSLSITFTHMPHPPLHLLPLHSLHSFVV
jgi:hypothetical protein